MVNSWYAPDRYASRHLQDRFSSLFSRTFSGAVRNKDNIVCLQLRIGSLCGHNFCKGKRNILGTLRSLADEPGRIQFRVRVSPLSEGDSLQHGNFVAIFHDKSAGLVDVADDIYDTRLAHDNCVARLNRHVILHRLRRTSQKRYLLGMLWSIAMCK